MKRFSQIKTLQAAIQYFDDEQVCVDSVAAMRWPEGKPECPVCAKLDHYYLPAPHVTYGSAKPAKNSSVSRLEL